MVDSSGDQVVKLRSFATVKNEVNGNVTSDEKLTEENLPVITESSKIVSGFSLNLELKIKKLKRSLEGWREIILATQSILLWEKQWHPTAILGASSFIFFLLWLIDPSLLTTIAVIGLIATISDYLVPTMSSGLFRNDNWTGAHEKKLEDLCRMLVIYYTHMTTLMGSFYLMRTVRPKMYYTILTSALLTMAWLGSTINNLLLTYLVMTWILLLPGLEHKGLVSKYTQTISTKFQDLIKSNKTE